MEINANLAALNNKLEAKRSINYLRFDAKKETEEVTQSVVVNGQRWTARYRNEDGEMLFSEDGCESGDLYTLEEIRALAEVRKLIMSFDYKEAVASAQEEEEASKIEANFYLLVSGSRDSSAPGNNQHITSYLEKVREKYPNLVLIHGDARGVDKHCASWARHHKLRLVGYPAAWEVHGKRAGIIRNSEMVARVSKKLNEGHKVGVLAFPGPQSVGTHHLIREAKAAGLPVKVCPIK